MEWQPIETAPSKRAVLVYFHNCLGNGRIVKAVHYPKHWEEDCDSDFAEYCEESDEYYAPEGWYEDVFSETGLDYSYIFIDRKPTHWMPLPSPPPKGSNSTGLEKETRR